MFSHRIYVNMSFRNHKFRPLCPAPTLVKDTILSHSIVDGVDIVTPVEVDAAELAAKLPAPDDYKLSNLLKAGVDVRSVNPVIYSDVDADVEHFVSENLPLEDDPLSPDVLENSNN